MSTLRDKIYRSKEESTKPHLKSWSSVMFFPATIYIALRTMKLISSSERIKCSWIVLREGYRLANFILSSQRSIYLNRDGAGKNKNLKGTFKKTGAIKVFKYQGKRWNWIAEICVYYADFSLRIYMTKLCEETD